VEGLLDDAIRYGPGLRAIATELDDAHVMVPHWQVAIVLGGFYVADILDRNMAPNPR
jgi:hypothetical protein